MIFNFCAVCGSTENLYNHHWVPRSKGGPDSETNLITLCGHCHQTIHKGIAVKTKALTQSALDHKRERGERLGGGIRYGWRVVNRELVKDDAEQAVVSLIMRLHTTGHSVRDIVAVLATKDVKTRKGTAMGTTQVFRIIKDNG